MGRSHRCLLTIRAGCGNLSFALRRCYCCSIQCASTVPRTLHPRCALVSCLLDSVRLADVAWCVMSCTREGSKHCGSFPIYNMVPSNFLCFSREGSWWSARCLGTQKNNYEFATPWRLERRFSVPFRGRGGRHLRTAMLMRLYRVGRL